MEPSAGHSACEFQVSFYPLMSSVCLCSAVRDPSHPHPGHVVVPVAKRQQLWCDLYLIYYSAPETHQKTICFRVIISYCHTALHFLCFDSAGNWQHFAGIGQLRHVRVAYPTASCTPLRGALLLLLQVPSGRAALARCPPQAAAGAGTLHAERRRQQQSGPD